MCNFAIFHVRSSTRSFWHTKLQSYEIPSCQTNAKTFLEIGACVVSMSYRRINHKIMYTPGTGRQSGRSKNKYRLSQCEKQYSRNIPSPPAFSLYPRFYAPSVRHLFISAINTRFLRKATAELECFRFERTTAKRKRQVPSKKSFKKIIYTFKLIKY